jgi:ketosteroid isomerase-like protein
MSKENVEIVRQLYAAMDRSVPPYGFGGPPESIKRFIDPEIEWQGPREFPDLHETVYGYEGMARYAAKIAEALDDYRMSPERFIDAGDNRVLVFSREGGRGRGSGVEVQTHLTAHLWTLKDGKAIRMQKFEGLVRCPTPDCGALVEPGRGPCGYCPPSESPSAIPPSV